MIECIDPNQMNFFCDMNLGNFKIEPSQPQLQNNHPIDNKVQWDEEGIRKIYFSGACSWQGNRAGVVFIAPRCKIFKYSFLLSYEYTNNVVEYEAFLLGLNLSIKHGIKSLSVFGDSELIESQVRSK